MENSHNIKSREQLEDSVQAVTCFCVEIVEGPRVEKFWERRFDKMGWVHGIAENICLTKEARENVLSRVKEKHEGVSWRIMCEDTRHRFHFVKLLQ